MTDANHHIEVLEDKNVFLFQDHMSEASKNAAKECHVFANQAATAEYHPKKQTAEWFDMYIQVMQQCGWLPINYELSQISDSNMKLDLSNLVGKGLQAAIGFISGNGAAGALDLGKSIISTLANSEEAVEILNRKSHEEDRTGLSLAKCDESASGEVVMLLSAIQTDAEPDKDANYLLFKWSSSGTSNYTGSAALSLHRSLYEANRDVLISRVHGNARATLLSLKLKR
ncbi:hypothetical protein [Pseudomonas sp. PSKL.D1]|uniref:hypothetical protein n=1 Tax=Pseudomonas sp. PSKL.D1 TaxID=3029060 RepID=UPI002380E361|nr:hypothetical protein [Pseudomonas sp. PSKL.D1]WDY57448.1 hypothetical protein PVV54_23205 [Pseudomonas sp. PSKL.D1]